MSVMGLTRWEHLDIHGIGSDLESTTVYPLHIMRSGGGLPFTGNLDSPRRQAASSPLSYSQEQ